MSQKTVVIAARVSSQTKESLQKLAEATDRSVSWHAQKAMERYLGEEAARAKSSCSTD